ncbi:MAG: LysE family transporter [Eubacteriales bacterium]
MLLKGFRFGMILQFAVGPIALFIFQVAVNSSFITAFTGCIGVALVDMLYIVLAILGIGTLLGKYSGVKNILKYFGGIVLVIFGLSIFLSAIGISILPSISAGADIKNVFLKSIILTISSPLTIIFWAGVFSAKLAEEKIIKKDMYVFGMGAVCSTLFFLTLISGVGVFANSFLNDTLLKILNSVVGIIIILFGIKTMVKKPVENAG